MVPGKPKDNQIPNQYNDYAAAVIRLATVKQIAGKIIEADQEIRLQPREEGVSRKEVMDTLTLNEVIDCAMALVTERDQALTLMAARTEPKFLTSFVENKEVWPAEMEYIIYGATIRHIEVISEAVMRGLDKVKTKLKKKEKA